MENNLLVKLRQGEHLAFSEQVLLTFQLSVPAILAQITTVIMEYIDAGMVGRLGANASASIGLMASCTWLFGGLCAASGVGFTVQIAQEIGAGRQDMARKLVKQGLVVAMMFSTLLLLIGIGVSIIMPGWLGGSEEICRDATIYFLIYALSLPLVELNYISAGMIQCSGNMKIPSLLNVLMCFMNVIFNMMFIFDSATYQVLGMRITLPGLGLGVAGAAIGTALAEALVALTMLSVLLFGIPALKLRKGEKFQFNRAQLKRAFKIAYPVAIEQMIMSGAQVVSTHIVAPLGTIAIAANSFAVTAEGLCYMPGYGISSASTTLIGQSIGAKRNKLAFRLGWLTTGLGMALMAGTGVLMYIFAPFMIGILSPDPAIQELGAAVLRIEAFAEPLFAASIVATGVLRGAGDTFMASAMSLFSMWIIRLPFAYFLSRNMGMGLRGVWTAMCIELCVKGVLFLLVLARKKWYEK